MKAVQWFAPRDLRLVDMPKPAPAPYEALIRVESTGICGSDMHSYLDGRIGDTVITSPLVLGHEYAGVIEAVGDRSDPALVGKRVAVEPGLPCYECEWCRSGHYNVCPRLEFPGLFPFHGALCEYKTARADFCFPVPNSMTSAEAALVEPLAVAVHTVELARLRPGETAAVLGLGPIGLLTAAVAKLCGVSCLYGSDLLEYRVRAGQRHGVDCAFNAAEEDTVDVIMKETCGRGVDVVFDCARSVHTPGIACRILRPAGRAVLTGISGESDGVLPVDVARRKELTLTWCRRFLFNYPAAIELAGSGKVDLRSLITHSFPLEQAQDAFELVAQFADGVLKVSIDQIDR